ncbi:EF-hand calcium-binding domain-containing protein 4B isoform X2 [Octopus bimaculoides]|uniref:EF-hand calcium-binding domain-containing protein 4B isoform X2 n=1 Tax=Octopus bimaculoides TaxID=37653 RepID=UPI00071C2F76|nr:EF-hand calcium-binding domain-containing protein 4B isoform X2 [Octopus bimaculoides]|eukprot:XP_014771100.1 PREDICTED: ras and EF-hand domain-containing protein homolog isoform X2 [Octopus bimaculoides]
MYETETGTMGSTNLTVDDLQDMQYKKSRELFILCDKEGKGFVNKFDLQRLQPELSLPPEALEQVFDILDDDKNGYLTLKEFTEGFHRFIGIPAEPHQEEHVYGVENEEMDDQAFTEMFTTVGAKDVIHDDGSIKHIKELWIQLRREDDPVVVENFEDFLSKITKDLKKKQDDLKELETALKVKTIKCDDEVTKLYEEMEYQIKQEKEAILNKEKTKESNFREEMEKELYEKEYQLHNLITRQKEMEQKLKDINYSEMEAKTTNDRLAKDRDELLYRLKQSQECIEEQSSYIQQLHQQQKDEKRERSKIALKLTEGIAIERESLVKQLDHLRNINRKLQDDKDEAEARRASSKEFSPNSELARPKLKKRGSILADYFNPDARSNGNLDEDIESDDDCFEDDLTSIQEVEDEDVDHMSHKILQNGLKNSKTKTGKQKRLAFSKSGSQSSISVVEDLESTERKKNFAQSEKDRINSLQNCDVRPKTPIELQELNTHSSKRNPNALHCNNEKRISQKNSLAGKAGESAKTPERVFKIVFVGDSGVGKSSFIHRFCNDDFQPTFAATIGVDFRIKSIEVGGHLFALQLWDTAGQERFRSITKQYFRKADGVLIMYDVTSEHSLVNVRNWMTSVNETVDPNTVIVIVGNKTDLYTDDNEQSRQFKMASRLAEENNALLYETSAKDGSRVFEAMHAMACVLKEKEDEELEKVLELNSESSIKKKCCS